MARPPRKKKTSAKKSKPSKNIVGYYWQRIRDLRWWERYPIYLLILVLSIAFLNWLVELTWRPVKNPNYGVSFSILAAEEYHSDWHANYLALLNDLGYKNLRLMSYWDMIEPQPGKYDFTDLDWQIQQATEHGAKVSLAIGFRQPRWPECHEPDWAKTLPVNGTRWTAALNDYLKTVVNRYNSNPTIVSYQLENESKNNWFGDCRGSNAPTQRLVEEFNLVKNMTRGKPVDMSLSDEHGFPIGQPVPDAYGFSIYRVVYTNNLPIHFYLTYPITDWYHRMRVWYIEHIKHRPVFIHELQLEPWGPKPPEEMSTKDQYRSMSPAQMKKNIDFAAKTGIKDEYMWGAEWWYWRKTQMNDPGPWNVIKQQLERVQNSSD